MPAYYKFVKLPHLAKDKGKSNLYPRFVSQNPLKKDELLEFASSTSGFSQPQITGLLQLLQDVIVWELSHGRNVQLEGIGTFSLTLESRPVTDESEIRGESIHVKDIVFRSSPDLKGRLKTTHFYRQENPPKETTFHQSLRRERMMNYLSDHSYITRNDYMVINNCSKATALRDLKLFVKEGLIERSYLGIQPLYRKKEI